LKRYRRTNKLYRLLEWTDWNRRGTHIFLVNSKSAANACGQYQQVAELGLDAYPVVILVPYVKVTCAGVQMLLVEHAYFFLIRAQSLWRWRNFFTMGIVAGFGKRINFSLRRFNVDEKIEKENPEYRQFCFREVFSISMGKPAVSLSS